MTHFYLTVYTVIAFLLSGVDFYFAVRAFGKKNRVGRALGHSACFAGIITLAYVLSVNVSGDRAVSVLSSVTFAGIDCMLVSLTYYAFLVTGAIRHRGCRALNTAIRLLASADIVVMAVNVFTGFAVTYQRLDPVGIGYRMKLPYQIHLGFSYFMILVTLAVLLYKCVHTPSQYRNQYVLIAAAIGVVVLINAAFLFQEDSFFTKVDCSILGYSIGLYLMYWTAYDYRENDMLESLSMTVFENVGQGIVLFDYMDELIMYNRKAAQLLPGVRFEREMPGADFLNACGIARDGREQFSLQCDAGNGVPLRCDFSSLKDKRGRVLGHLCVFTDLSRLTDITTGFEYAKDLRYTQANDAQIARPAAVTVFDIIGLREVNRMMGRDEGDKRIRALAKQVRARMPAGSIFLRGYEANLIAICPGKAETDVRGAVEDVVANSDSDVAFGLSAATASENGAEGRSLTRAMEIAYRSIQIKKLLSPGSVRSQALASLVRALEEADADTESHVRRTRKMGALLGQRIHLTDAELTQLELLCLLHDIGKIGIPLEILNKPGKLAEQEWAVLRTHPDKGYQIAMSSDELKSIAGMILCHHERWDGRGYPRGLAGENIPILSRIIAVVDAYDAMVNDRSYRKAMPPEAAQEEIRRNAGTQFDPRLAEEFLAMLAEHPDLAAGEKVGAEERRVRDVGPMPEAKTGNTTPIPYSRYILDVDNVVLEVDDHFQEITGYSAEDAVGRMIQLDLIPPEDRAFYLVQVSNQLSRADMAYLRHEILRKDGERIRVACCGKRFFDSADKAFKNEIIIFQL